MNSPQQSNPSKPQPVSKSSPAPESEWIGQVYSKARSLDQEIQYIVTRRPVAAAVTAVGIGALASFVISRLDPSHRQQQGSSNTKILEAFSVELKPTLTRLESQLHSLSNESPSEVMDEIVEVIHTDMSKNPHQAIATAVGFGLGLTSLSGRHIMAGALEIGRLLAMRALSSIEIKSESMKQQPKIAQVGGQDGKSEAAGA